MAMRDSKIPDNLGSYVVLSKTLTSSSILTTATDLTTAATGRFWVRDVIVRTDATTGLAGGTNLRIQSNNADGSPAILEQAITGLNGAKTVNLDTAGVVKTRTVLETGKKLQVLCTGTNCTGTGTVTIDMILMRLDPGATIGAA